MTSTAPLSSSPMHDPSSRRSKAAIVAGASSGIGLALAQKLIASGYRVVANVLTPSRPRWEPAGYVRQDRGPDQEIIQTRRLYEGISHWWGYRWVCDGVKSARR